MEKRNLTVIFLITLMGVMGVASITPAFPSIIRHFGITPAQVTLLITVFTLPGIFLAPVVGLLADRYGRKTILLPSLLMFGLAGAACALTKEWKLLLLFRLLQGTGASSLGLLNVTLIGDIFENKRRAEIMGYNAGVLSTGTAAYPALGGALALLGWQFPFLLPLASLPVALLVVFWLKNPEPHKKPHLKEYMIRTWKIINQKTVWGIFSINVILFIVLYGAFLSYFPQMMTERFGSDSLEIGLFMSGFSVITAITASQIRRINQILSAKKQLYIGSIFYALAMLLLAYSHSRPMLIIPLVLFGMAHGMLIPGIQTLLVGFAPLSERAGFMSVNGVVLRLRQTIGPVIIGVFYALGGVTFSFAGGALVAIAIPVILYTLVSLPDQSAG